MFFLMDSYVPHGAAALEQLPLLAAHVGSRGHAGVADAAGKPLGLRREAGEGGLKDLSEHEQFCFVLYCGFCCRNTHLL